MNIQKILLGFVAVPCFFGSQVMAQEANHCEPVSLRGSELTELIHGNQRQEFVKVLSQSAEEGVESVQLEGLLDDLSDANLANREFFEDVGLYIPCKKRKDGNWEVQLHIQDPDPKTFSVSILSVSPLNIDDLYKILDAANN